MALFHLHNHPSGLQHPVLPHRAKWT